MYKSIANFADSWAFEQKATMQVLQNLTNETLTLKPNENIRTIKDLAWHIALTPLDILAEMGTPNILSEGYTPPQETTVQEILDGYNTRAQATLEAVKTNYTDADLNRKINMYGEEWTIGQTLNMMIMHQTHHRGQLTVIMRLHGLKVTGVYGPAKEEWAAMNMEAMQ
ncbi:MAG: DinB family protein [Sphingobacteriales bacterium]|jgi:uncharacterized damage-inducible protein DinB|nr:DinB family protein [Sphingobacteriales bacterium]MBP9140299.1 DinB family protein [Chitinophagales bacterium]MDA0197174.1 DinB family protein [Bacteroidota bacterium]MBK6891419.1 DinB family protein [Sphingobacteriales bacterium]MBK7526749.1 DinB family protein [Sphingobacteriales bacterium]